MDSIPESVNVSGTFNLSSIRHDSIPEQNARHILINIEILSTIKASISQDSIIQNSISQISIPQNSFSQISSLQNTTIQVGIAQVNTPQTSSSQIGITQVGSSESHTVKIKTDKICSTQISIKPKTSSKITSHQIDSSQVYSPQNTLLVIEANQGKVPFSSRIASEQFFSSNIFSRTNHPHDFILQSINVINSTALTFWNSLLKPQTHFNINLVVKDLPTGQLADERSVLDVLFNTLGN